jgi:hypothetical protein
LGAVIDKKQPDKTVTFQKEDHIMKKNFPHLKMIRGILYREIKDGEKTINQLVFPEVYKKQVLQGLHDDIGHPGHDRTLSLLRSRFYWPCITADTETT